MIIDISATLEIGMNAGLRVERHLGIEERVGGEDAGRRHQQACSRRASVSPTASAPVLPPAPARFSTITGGPSGLGHLVADGARNDVGEAARRERRDQPDRTIGIEFAPSRRHDASQQNSAR